MKVTIAFMDPVGYQHANFFCVSKSRTNPSITGINGFFCEKRKNRGLIYRVVNLNFGQKFPKDEIEHDWKVTSLDNYQQCGFPPACRRVAFEKTNTYT